MNNSNSVHGKSARGKRGSHTKRKKTTGSLSKSRAHRSNRAGYGTSSSSKNRSPQKINNIPSRPGGINNRNFVQSPTTHQTPSRPIPRVGGSVGRGRRSDGQVRGSAGSTSPVRKSENTLDKSSSNANGRKSGDRKQKSNIRHGGRKEVKVKRTTNTPKTAMTGNSKPSSRSARGNRISSSIEQATTHQNPKPDGKNLKNQGQRISVPNTSPRKNGEGGRRSSQSNLQSSHKKSKRRIKPSKEKPRSQKNQFPKKDRNVKGSVPKPKRVQQSPSKSLLKRNENSRGHQRPRTGQNTNRRNPRPNSTHSNQRSMKSMNGNKLNPKPQRLQQHQQSQNHQKSERNSRTKKMTEQKKKNALLNFDDFESENNRSGSKHPNQSERKKKTVTRNQNPKDSLKMASKSANRRKGRDVVKNPKYPKSMSKSSSFGDLDLDIDYTQDDESPIFEPTAAQSHEKSRKQPSKKGRVPSSIVYNEEESMYSESSHPLDSNYESSRSENSNEDDLHLGKENKHKSQKPNRRKQEKEEPGFFKKGFSAVTGALNTVFGTRSSRRAKKKEEEKKRKEDLKKKKRAEREAERERRKEARRKRREAKREAKRKREEEERERKEKEKRAMMDLFQRKDQGVKSVISQNFHSSNSTPKEATDFKKKMGDLADSTNTSLVVIFNRFVAKSKAMINMKGGKAFIKKKLEVKGESVVRQKEIYVGENMKGLEEATNKTEEELRKECFPKKKEKKVEEEEEEKKQKSEEKSEDEEEKRVAPSRVDISGNSIVEANKITFNAREVFLKDMCLWFRKAVIGGQDWEAGDGRGQGQGGQEVTIIDSNLVGNDILIENIKKMGSLMENDEKLRNLLEIDADYVVMKFLPGFKTADDLVGRQKVFKKVHGRISFDIHLQEDFVWKSDTEFRRLQTQEINVIAPKIILLKDFEARDCSFNFRATVEGIILNSQITTRTSTFYSEKYFFLRKGAFVKYLEKEKSRPIIDGGRNMKSTRVDNDSHMIFGLEDKTFEEWMNEKEEETEGEESDDDKEGSEGLHHYRKKKKEVLESKKNERKKQKKRKRGSKLERITNSLNAKVSRYNNSEKSRIERRKEERERREGQKNDNRKKKNKIVKTVRNKQKERKKGRKTKKEREEEENKKKVSEERRKRAEKKKELEERREEKRKKEEEARKLENKKLQEKKEFLDKETRKRRESLKKKVKDGKKKNFPNRSRRRNSSTSSNSSIGSRISRSGSQRNSPRNNSSRRRNSSSGSSSGSISSTSSRSSSRRNSPRSSSRRRRGSKKSESSNGFHWSMEQEDEKGGNAGV